MKDPRPEITGSVNEVQVQGLKLQGHQNGQNGNSLNFGGVNVTFASVIGMLSSEFSNNIPIGAIVAGLNRMSGNVQSYSAASVDPKPSLDPTIVAALSKNSDIGRA